MKVVGDEISWKELSKFKVPFSTEKMKMLATKITQLHYMQPDPRKVELVESNIEEEPLPAKQDIEAPY